MPRDAMARSRGAGRRGRFATWQTATPGSGATARLVGEMHKNGLEHLSQVRWAIPQTDGVLTLLPEGGQGLPVSGGGDRDAGLV